MLVMSVNRARIEAEMMTMIRNDHLPTGPYSKIAMGEQFKRMLPHYENRVARFNREQTAAHSAADFERYPYLRDATTEALKLWMIDPLRNGRNPVGTAFLFGLDLASRQTIVGSDPDSYLARLMDAPKPDCPQICAIFAYFHPLLHAEILWIGPIGQVDSEMARLTAPSGIGIPFIAQVHPAYGKCLQAHD